MFTFFHESDDYRQALFSVDFHQIKGGFEWPETSNTFEQRVRDVLALMPGGLT